MDWLFLALFCAFFAGTNDALSKFAMKDTDEYIVGWLKLVISAPVFLSMLFFVERPALDAVFFGTVVLLIPLEMVAVIFYLKALKRSPLSLSVPFLALTPVFSILFAYVIVGERVTFMGAAGILCVAIGAYMLNADLIHIGLLEPIKAIYREAGSRYMIFVAFIFSITSAMGKLALIHSSPLFFAAAYFPVFGLAMTLVVFIRAGVKKTGLGLPRGKPLVYVVLALSFIAAILLHFLAISRGKVAYVISVKRLSLLVGIAYGRILFKEVKVTDKFIGGFLMLVGVILILIAR